MLHTRRECLDAANMLESRTREGNPLGFYREISQLLENRQISPNEVSMSDLFEAFVANGRELLETFRPGYRHDVSVFQEAGDAVNTGAFSNIIGQITYTTVLDALQSPQFIGMGLTRTDPATTQQPEILPGIGMIGDRAEDVGEDEAYPRVGLSEEYITIPRKPKDGFILPITEEAIWEDKTGGLLTRRANGAAESMGITMEKEALNMVLGVTTSYSRNGGPEQATYGDTHTQGDFDNETNQILNDYTDIDAALLLFDDITDPNTGEPIDVSGNLQLVVPGALELTALGILNAIQIQHGPVTTTADVDNIQTITGNVLQQQTRRTFQLVTNQYVSDISTSTAEWWIGRFQDAFGYREVWPLQVFRMDRNSEAGFDRDIVTQIKVRRKGAFYVREPRYVVHSTAAA